MVLADCYPECFLEVAMYYEICITQRKRHWGGVKEWIILGGSPLLPFKV